MISFSPCDSHKLLKMTTFPYFHFPSTSISLTNSDLELYGKRTLGSVALGDRDSAHRQTNTSGLSARFVSPVIVVATGQH